MGLFDAFRRPSRSSDATDAESEWQSAGEWWQWRGLANVVVGESYRARELQRVFAVAPYGDDFNRAVEVHLEREPTNAHDPNAIRVSVTLPSERAVHAGYVSREIAAEWAPAMDRSGVTGFSCCGLVRGRDGRYGVFFWPERLLDVRGRGEGVLELGLSSDWLAQWPR